MSKKNKINNNNWYKKIYKFTSIVYIIISYQVSCHLYGNRNAQCKQTADTQNTDWDNGKKSAPPTQNWNWLTSPRRMVMFTPAGDFSTMTACECEMSAPKATWFTCTSWSPFRRPACSAKPPGVTECTKMPGCCAGPEMMVQPSDAPRASRNRFNSSPLPTPSGASTASVMESASEHVTGENSHDTGSLAFLPEKALTFIDFA